MRQRFMLFKKMGITEYKIITHAAEFRGIDRIEVLSNDYFE